MMVGQELVVLTCSLPPAVGRNRQAQFPGRFFKGRICSTRPPQACRHALHEQRGGQRNGGLIFGSHQSSDGKPTLSDILSFDEYQEGAITLNPQFKEDSNASTNFDFVLFSRSLNGGDLRSIEPDSHWNRE
jgi:hypothetical protein